MGTELEKRSPESTAMVSGRGISITNLADLMDFARMVAESDFAPKDFRGKPGNCAIAIANGMEVGLPPMASVQNTAVINGRPSLYGDVPLAICMNHPLWDGAAFFEKLEKDPTQGLTAVCTVRRSPSQPVTRKFSEAMAKRAGLLSRNQVYGQYLERMLQCRARAWALKDAFPDALKGVSIKEYDDAGADMVEVTATVIPTAQPSTDSPAARKLRGEEATASSTPRVDNVTVTAENDNISRGQTHDDTPGKRTRRTKAEMEAARAAEEAAKVREANTPLQLDPGASKGPSGGKPAATTTAMHAPVEIDDVVQGVEDRGDTLWVILGRLGKVQVTDPRAFDNAAAAKGRAVHVIGRTHLPTKNTLISSIVDLADLDEGGSNSDDCEIPFDQDGGNA